MMGPVILGAGPAGCAAAIALARAGAQPILLDRAREVPDALCGGFLSWRTAARLAELGIDPGALGARPVRRLALFAGDRHAAVALPGTSWGLSRRALDSELRHAAMAAGARLEIDTARAIEGTTVLGRRLRWSGDGLLLATGKHDVRGSMRPRGSDPALGMRLRLPASPARNRILHERIELHLFDGGYAGIVLQEDGSANVCLAVRKSRLAKSGGEPRRLLEEFADASPVFAERLGSDWGAAALGTIGSVPYGFIAPPAAPGVFRLGDQGAVIPSLAGEGIAIALASGTLAARHWFAGGAAASRAFQHDLARRAALPVRTATLAWNLGERPGLAALGVALAGRLPHLVRWAMTATRIDAPASLAPLPAAS